MASYPISPHITGVAQPKITQRNLNRILMLIPDERARELFQNIVDPIVNQVFALKAQIEALAEARDLLLPRLMSGEVAV